MSESLVFPGFTGQFSLMYDITLITVSGLPENANVKEFTRICQQCEGLEPHVMTLVTALFHDEQQVLLTLVTAIFHDEQQVGLTLNQLLQYWGNILAGIVIIAQDVHVTYEDDAF